MTDEASPNHYANRDIEYKLKTLEKSKAALPKDCKILETPQPDSTAS